MSLGVAVGMFVAEGLLQEEAPVDVGLQAGVYELGSLPWLENSSGGGSSQQRSSCKEHAPSELLEAWSTQFSSILAGQHTSNL